MTSLLKPVMSEEDWQAMHAIRRATLFVAGRHDQAIVYDENHPDDRDPANQPFLLLVDGMPAGVVRLDRRSDGEGVVRLVGIVPELQRQGHGRAMGELIDAEARRLGIQRLLVNAHQDAVGFYLATGWRRKDWDPSELTGLAADCTQLTKSL